MYVQIVVNVPRVSGVFDYHVPDALVEQIKPGCLVEVPFGNQTLQGIVLKQVALPQVPDTRPITALIDPQPVVTALQMRLAQTMAEDTFSTLAACIGMMVPPGLRQQADTLYRSLEKSRQASVSELEALSPLQRRLVEYMSKPTYRHNGIRGRQLDAQFSHQEWRKSAKALESKGWITAQSILTPPSVRPKTVRTVQLAISPAELDACPELGRGEAGERRAKILEFLRQEPWPVDVSWVYAASSGNLSDLKKLAEMGLVVLGESEVWRDPLEEIGWVAADVPDLNRDQNAVWNVVQDAIFNPDERIRCCCTA